MGPEWGFKVVNKIMARQTNYMRVSFSQPTRGSGKAELWERERDRHIRYFFS